MSQIREEFEKAYQQKQFACGYVEDHYDLALWAAKWMAERCADLFDENEWMEEEIRKLAKELEP